MSKKIAYIIHPFRNDKENNEKNMKFIAAVAVRSGTVPIATALYFPHFLNEEDEAERLEGIDCGLTLMECCDEVWLFGFNISEGTGLCKGIETSGSSLRYAYEPYQSQNP